MWNSIKVCTNPKCEFKKKYEYSSYQAIKDFGDNVDIWRYCPICGAELIKKPWSPKF